MVEAAGGRLTLVEDRFSALDEVASALGADAVDGVLLDVGVSSMQLDQGERGFSFRLDGPLEPFISWLAGKPVEDLHLGRPDLETLFRHFYAPQDAA